MTGLLGIIAIIVIIGIKEWIQRTKAEIDAQFIQQKKRKNRG